MQEVHRAINNDVVVVMKKTYNNDVVVVKPYLTTTTKLFMLQLENNEGGRTMNPFIEYVQSVMKNKNISSATELGLLIGKKQSYMSSLMRGNHEPGEDVCIKIAELAGHEPEKVLLMAHAAYAGASKPYWDNLLKKVVNMSLVGAFGIGISELSRQLYILC